MKRYRNPQSCEDGQVKYEAIMTSKIDSKNFSHIDIGALAKIGESNEGKADKKFLKEILGLTGMEISITKLPKGSATPFFHSHKQNEELYIVVEGRGQMQLDKELIDVKEGSFVSIPTFCPRALRASTDSDLIYLCIQAKTDSLEQHTKGDGIRHEDIAWQN
jgi:mannose-6-phosphate isomerase-like protein (cupin superfamily)